VAAGAAGGRHLEAARADAAGGDRHELAGADPWGGGVCRVVDRRVGRGVCGVNGPLGLATVVSERPASSNQIAASGLHVKADVRDGYMDVRVRCFSDVVTRTLGSTVLGHNSLGSGLACCQGRAKGKTPGPRAGACRFARAGVARATGRAGGVAPAQRPSESGLDGRIQRALFDVLTARRVRAAPWVPEPSVTSARPRGVFACATPPARPVAGKLGWLAKRNASGF